jgi:hypothetical protein
MRVVISAHIIGGGLVLLDNFVLHIHFHIHYCNVASSLEKARKSLAGGPNLPAQQLVLWRF